MQVTIKLVPMNSLMIVQRRKLFKAPPTFIAFISRWRALKYL